jgi:hypothetical protein
VGKTLRRWRLPLRLASASPLLNGIAMVATLSLCNEVIRALDFPSRRAFAAPAA